MRTIIFGVLLGGRAEEERKSRWREGGWRLGRAGCVCGMGRCHSWSGRWAWRKVEVRKTWSTWTRETSTILFRRW